MHIVLFLGSLRKESYNRKLLNNILPMLNGQTTDVVDLKETVLPVFDGDLDGDQTPAEAVRLAERVKRADAFIFVSPEYNFNIPGGLKNAVDWVSRSKDRPMHDKPVMLTGATQGPYGCVRLFIAMRQMLVFFNALVMPRQVGIPSAAKAFDEQGKLIDPKQIEMLQTAVNDLLRVTQALKKN